MLVFGTYFIGLETLYLAKQVGMINGKFAFIVSSRSPICQEGSNSWNRILVIYQLFEFQVQVDDH